MGVNTFSLTNGGTSELMIPADQSRSWLMIVPITEASLINFGATAGVQATGSYTWAANPANNDTLGFNGVTFTVKTTVVDPTVEIQRGASLALTLAAALATLNASVDPLVSIATYSSSGAGIVNVTADAGGADGNAYTLDTATGGNVTRSAATLTGGSDTVGGIPLAAGASIRFTAKELPSIKDDIYIVSATNAAKTTYISGTW